MADRPDKIDEDGSGQDASDADHYSLMLYINGTSPKSMSAVTNLRALCERFVPDRYKLEIFDITVFPELAKKAQLIGVPALIKLRPLPVKHFIGDMSQTEKLIARLGFPPEPSPADD